MANIIKRPGWYLPESAATPEGVYQNRREFLQALGFGAAAIGLAGWMPAGSAADVEDLYKNFPMGDHPLPGYEKNPKYVDAGRPLTSLEDDYNPLTFNNFYEFGFDKESPAKLSKGFKLDPYVLEIDGLVESPVKLDLDQIEKLGLEERVYRFRCVEAWAMTVPWLGVPLRKVLEQAKIKSEAKFVAFTTFHDPKQAPGQKDSRYNWPYQEGLRLDEAMNELPLVTTGMFGKRLLPQSGTPLRIIVPWKYGYKGPKSVVKMTLVAEQPSTLWNDAIPSEYKFYSNVDPEVSHPRWSQSSEKLLGDVVERVPTQWFNGYGEYVADLYKDMPRTLY